MSTVCSTYALFGRRMSSQKGGVKADTENIQKSILIDQNDNTACCVAVPMPGVEPGSLRRVLKSLKAEYDSRYTTSD